MQFVVSVLLSVLCYICKCCETILLFLHTGVTLPVFEHYQEGGDSKSDFIRRSDVILCC